MTRTSIALDANSLRALRRMAKRLEVSQSEIVRRSLRMLEQREAAAPANPAQALDWLATLPDASLTSRQLKAKVKKMRAERRAADEARA